MSEQWYITREERKTGPYSSSQLRRFATEGKLLPSDQIWKDGIAKPVPASTVRELFADTVSAAPSPSLGPSPLPPVSNQQSAEKSQPSSLVTGPSLLQRAKAGAADLAAKAKVAAQLAGKQTEKTKLVQINLPRAYQALGKHIHSGRRVHEKFPKEFEIIDGFLRQLDVIKTGATARTAPQSVGEKAKAMAVAAKEMAEAKTIQLRLNHALGELGKATFATDREQSGPEALIQSVLDCRSRIDSLNTDISNLESAHKGGWITPRRLMIGGGITGAFLILGFFGSLGPSGRLFSNSQANRASQLTSASTESHGQSPDHRGAFSDPQHDELNREEAAELVKQRKARGDASPVAVAMGALVTQYKANPEKFKGKNGEVSKMQAIVEAYQKGEQTYTYDDPTIGKKVTNDLTKELGEKGVSHVQGVFTEAGGTDQDFNASRQDKRSRANIAAGYARLSHKAELAKMIDRSATQHTVSQEVNKKIEANEAGSHFQGMSDDDLSKTKADTSKVITSAILESSGMTPEKQLDHLQKTIEPELEQMFGQQGHADPKVAAKQMANNVIGADPAHQRTILNRIVTHANNRSKALTGVSLKANHQLMGEDQSQKAAGGE